MATLSDAVAVDRISRIVGYKIQKGLPVVEGVNLPQRIAILGCANTANESTAPTVPTEVTSAAKAGELYGFGSPIHQVMRILRPATSDGVGCIPTYIYRQTEPVGAVAAVKAITVTTASVTANKTHTVVINGRETIDGSTYSYTVTTDDDQDSIALKIVDAVNSVLGTPVVATINATNSNQVDLTSKYAGVVSDELTISVDVDSNSAGITYVVSSETAGAGEHEIGSPFISSAWNTIVINPYTFSTALDRLEVINGIPLDTPTGNYTATAFRPFVSLFGNTSKTATDLTTITDVRKAEVTNAICPAPGSAATTWEAAANMGYLLAIQAQASPHLDVAGQLYPDMPIPSDGDIGDFVDYTNRDVAVKLGSSTVDLNSDEYEVQDLVTTYHPVGETPPQFRFVRSLVQDFNIRYGYKLLEDINVRDKAIVENDQIVSVQNTVKPVQWIQIVRSYADDLSARAIITDADYMKESILVQTGETNPDRLETFFRYKRSPFARIASTTGEANFAFGLNS